MRPDARCYVLVGLLALSLLAASPALTASAYDEVPADHWAYPAMDYLQRIGLLEGYPEGFWLEGSEYRLKNNDTLLRYDFIQGIVRADDFLEDGVYQDHVIWIMIDLYEEFGDQISSRHPVDPPKVRLCRMLSERGPMVPEDHWAHNAIGYFLEIGLLSNEEFGYGRTPNRKKDFQDAVVAAKSALDSWQGTEEEIDSFGIMIETLRAEFSDHSDGLFLSSSPEPPAPSAYEIVQDTHWAYPALHYVVACNYLKSSHFDFFDLNADHMFADELLLTRAEFDQAAFSLAVELMEMEESGQSYPHHLDFLSLDLAREFNDCGE